MKCFSFSNILEDASHFQDHVERRMFEDAWELQCTCNQCMFSCNEYLSVDRSKETGTFFVAFPSLSSSFGLPLWAWEPFLVAAFAPLLSSEVYVDTRIKDATWNRISFLDTDRAKNTNTLKTKTVVRHKNKGPLVRPTGCWSYRFMSSRSTSYGWIVSPLDQVLTYKKL